MFEAGIVDPAKVIRSALQNAVDRRDATTECTYDKPEPKDALPGWRWRWWW